MSIGARIRHHLWRTACSLSGGLTVTGSWRHRGGCIVVANHGSHADTAALLAALPPSAAPVFAAAADYWFDVPVRRFLITTLAAGLPVRRTTGSTYTALLDAVQPALAAGRAVVVFPEGTRSCDGEIAEFRSGALHLARDCGVPVIPVALLGTREVLPKNGRYRPGPMEVRIGDPVDPETVDTASLRDTVAAARDGAPVRTRTSRVWSAVARIVDPRVSVLLAFLWGFAEALSWPIIAEMALITLAAAVPRRVMPWAVALSAGSTVGILTTSWLASRGILLAAPWTTARMAATAYDQLAAGPHAMMNQALSGIPSKVYARAAGLHHIDLWALAGWTLLERGLRICIWGVGIWWLARLLHPWLRRMYGTYLLVVMGGFALALTAIVTAWS
ncbi:1-acyl-sn-glycerol-3-phosphate acyltransferase [Mycolicibacterium fortuitum]|uniref:1-acyl-sn-glycerol-3-phosphate acyltransferase n=1 Tax=Mycolicibacterium fortuitum TaxID=1766 RepID=UPI00261BE1DC|nr:1-acyl-sn-glycerol-3-phosphate acyltransferase [Mycolicibacterium fortuitum]